MDMVAQAIIFHRARGGGGVSDHSHRFGLSICIVSRNSILAKHVIFRVDICREMYDYAMSTSPIPDDPFLSMRTPSGSRQVLTFAVIRQAVKAVAVRLQ